MNAGKVNRNGLTWEEWSRAAGYDSEAKGEQAQAWSRSIWRELTAAWASGDDPADWRAIDDDPIAPR